MTLDEFVHALSLTDPCWFFGPYGMIRGEHHKPYGFSCPISAVSDSVECFYSPYKCSTLLGLTDDQIESIIEASDNKPYQRYPDLRRRLLDACGLSEKASQ